MPELYTHRQFGEHILGMIATFLDVDKEIFMWAQEGPDFWAYLTPSKYANRSKVMHACNAEDFIGFLLEKYPNDRLVLSYAMGFLCHMIYDEMAHPFVEYRINDPKAPWYCGGHMVLERAIDVLKMKEHGGRIRSLCKAWPFGKAKKLKQSLDSAYEEVYGWKNAYSEMRLAYCRRYLFYLAFWDPFWLVYAIGYLLKNDRIKAFSYHGKVFPNIDILNNNHNYWGDSDSSFDEITGNAIAVATEKIALYCHISRT